MNVLSTLDSNAGLRLLALGVSAPTTACLFSIFVCRLHRHASAAARHLIWVLAFVMMAVSALVALPGMRVAVPILPSATAAPIRGVPSPRLPAGAVPVADEAAATGTPLPLPTPAPGAAFSTPIPHYATQASHGVPWQILLLSSWAIGCVFLSLKSLAGVIRLRRIIQRSQNADDPLAAGLLRDLRAFIALPANVRLLVSRDVATPLAARLLRPVLILPDAALKWPSQMIRMALIHELAHVERNDLWCSALARLAASFYWFNPMVWHGLRSMHAEAEMAADDSVVLADAHPIAYAECLVMLVRKFRENDRSLFPAIGMARERGIQARVERILDPGRRRLAPSRVVRLGVLSGAALVAAGALMIRPVAASPSPGREEEDVPAANAAPIQPGLIEKSSAGGDPKAVDAVRAFIEKRRSLFSGIRAFQLTGELDIVTDTNVNRPIVRRYNFRCWGKGDQIKEVVELLGADGKPKSTTTYYLDARQIVEVDESIRSPKKFAKRFTLGRAPNIGLLNFCPAMLEYAFLDISISSSGIPAIRPNDLAKNERWTAMLGGLNGHVEEGDAAFYLTRSDPNGSSTVEFLKRPDLDDKLQIDSISFFSDEGKTLDRRVKVLEFLHDRDFGELGRAFSVYVYQGPAPARLMATWQFSVETLAINGPIDDGTFVFDPATVDTIDDGDSQAFSKVDQADPVPHAARGAQDGSSIPDQNAAAKPKSAQVAEAQTEAGADVHLKLLPITIEEKNDELTARRFTLHVPIQRGPHAKVDPHKLVIQALFFDTLNGRKVEPTGASVSSRWLKAPADWVEQDTEELAVDYQLPRPESGTTEVRKYYGYIVRVYYRGQLKDASTDREQLGRQYPPPPTLPKRPEE